jgi:hypothetical protein
MTPGIPPKPNAGSRPPARLARSLLVNLLIWFGLNLAILAGVTFIVFALLNQAGQTDTHTSFTYALICAIPPALTLSAIFTGRRILADLKK